MANQFEFVITDPSTKLKPGKSLLVRKHVMQGKNARPNSRRALRDRKKKAASHDEATDLEADRAWRIPGSLDDLTMIRFARSGISIEDQNLVVDAFASNVVNQALSPLERCVDFDKLETVWFEWVATDPTFLHLILSATHAIRDIRTPGWDGRKLGEQFTYHMKETLSLLSKRISNTDVTQDEPMLYIVIQLSLLAAVADDWNAATAHLAGLRRIVQLRGGWSFLQTRPKLHFKLDRLDLAYSLSSGRKPHFLHPRVSWEPVMKELSAGTGLYMPPFHWHQALRVTFLDFQRLAHTINLNTQKNKRYKAACFQDVLSNLQSRLMHLETICISPTEKLMRLCMLGLLAASFKLPGRRIPYTWLHNAFEIQYASVMTSFDTLENNLQIWTLLIAAILVAPERKPWIEEAWATIGCETNWRHVQDELMSLIWIEDIHGRNGRVAFEQLSTRSRKVL